jgi:hypothetical protein
LHLVVRDRDLRNSPPRALPGSSTTVSVGLPDWSRAASPCWRRPASPANDRLLSPRHEAVVAALNGVVGDHLARTNNPLAISMSLQASRRLSDTEQHCGLGLSTAGRATKGPERRVISVRPARLHRAVTAEYCAELNAGISRRRFLRRTGLWSDYNPDGETLNS